MKKISYIGVLLIFILATLVSANPTLQSIGAKTVREGDTLTIDLNNATAADSGSIVFSHNADKLTSFDAATGLFTWNTNYTNAGTHTVTFNVSDDNSTDSEAVTITVENYNPISVGSPTIGDDDQKRSNSRASDEDYENLHDETTFTITNNGNATIYIDSITSSAASSYNITFSDVPTSIAQKTSADVRIKGRIPEDLNSFFLDRTDQNDKKVDIGTINVVTAAGTSTAKAYMEAENQLAIEKIFVYVDNVKKYTWSSDDKTIKEIKPGNDIEIVIRSENNFQESDSEDLDIEDVEIRFKIDEHNIDVDETEDIGSISPESYEEGSITFEIEDDAEHGESNIKITLEGIDENGAKHGEIWELKIEVEREDHEVSIEDISYPETLSCNQKSFDLDVTIKNIGRDSNEDRVEVRVSSTDFGYTEREEEIDLGDIGSEDTITFTVPVSEDTKSGTKSVLIETFYNRIKPSNDDSIFVKIPECVEPKDDTTDDTTDDQDDATDDKDDTTVVIRPGINDTTDDTEPIIAGIETTSTEGSLLGSSGLLTILLVVIAVAVILLVALILVITTKKRPPQEPEQTF